MMRHNMIAAQTAHKFFKYIKKIKSSNRPCSENMKRQLIIGEYRAKKTGNWGGNLLLPHSWMQ
ncbi:MAG: hypothetical protein KAH18_00980 [Psychromonas sp.]|nr:hypothetical protein [Psychromonas sp.]